MPRLRSKLLEEEIAHMLREHLLENDDGVTSFSIPSESIRPAAVLVPLVRKPRGWHVLFTRRTDTLPEHRGQVSFPGGRCDPSDQSVEDTALREAFEEIGLDPKDVKVLGRLRSLLTTTNYWVTPVVGMIPRSYIFRIAEEEVSRVFTIPLAWLADPNNHEVRQRILPFSLNPVPVIYFKPYQGEVLWGVSAQIVLDLVKALKLC